MLIKSALPCLLYLIFFPRYCHAQARKDVSKSIRILNYTSFISDNTISSQGLSNTLELNNYHFTNYSTFSLLTFGSENQYTSARNTFNKYFKSKIRLKNSLAFIDGNSLLHDTVRVYWDPMKKIWSQEVVMSRYPSKDTLISTAISDRFFVAGFGIHSYSNTVNPGIEAYLIKKAGDRPDQNVQLSLVMDFFKQRKFSAFIHADLIRNSHYSRFNSDRLYFAEAELTAKVRPFTFSVKGGYGKSIFRYALLDNGYLEYTPIFLNFIYGFNTALNFPSWGGFYFNISQSGYHEPNDTKLYTSFYGGIKIILKKY